MQYDTVLLGLLKVFDQLCISMLHTSYLCMLIKKFLYHKALHFAYVLCMQ
jgi:hypothetical protein